MKHVFEKNMRIVTDLVAYFHSLGAREYHLDISMQDDVTEYRICSPLAHVSQEVVESLEKTLNKPRQHEVEQYYWGLSGEVETDPELDLVGMMVDEASTEYRDGQLSVFVRRYEQQ